LLHEKYQVEEIPHTAEFRREKRWCEARGEVVLLADGQETRHITYFTLNPGPNYFRGGHYHRRKVEKFYVVAGKLAIRLKDVQSGESCLLEVQAGQRVVIQPLCAHRFQALTPAQVIEYYASAYDPDDDIHFSAFEEEAQY
jgi:dTDP-4-dehydrorhamnose 3,5-epimerase-like enzyme